MSNYVDCRILSIYLLDLDLDSYAAGLVRHTRSGREMFGA